MKIKAYRKLVSTHLPRSYFILTPIKEKKNLFGSTRYTWTTYFEFKKVNFAKKWLVCGYAITTCQLNGKYTIFALLERLTDSSWIISHCEITSRHRKKNVRVAVWIIWVRVISQWVKYFLYCAKISSKNMVSSQGTKFSYYLTLYLVRYCCPYDWHTNDNPMDQR